jgi:putative FmdB family regulatory protein
MPTYQYRCVDCGSELETVQKFSDPSLTECPECDGTLRKVYSAVGVVFKGSGFYATDNRTKGKVAASAPTSGSTEKSSGSEKSSSSEKSSGKSSGSERSSGSEKTSSGEKSRSNSRSSSKQASPSTTSAA